MQLVETHREAGRRMPFRRAGRRDVAALHEWHVRAQGAPFFLDVAGPEGRYNYRDFAERCRKDASLWVAYRENNLAGFFLLTEIYPSLELANLHMGFFVECPLSDSSAAADLSAALQEACRQTGVSRLQLLLFPWETEKRALVEGIGFRQEGLLRDHFYHEGKRHDLLFMAWMDTQRHGE